MSRRPLHGRPPGLVLLREGVVRCPLAGRAVLHEAARQASVLILREGPADRPLAGPLPEGLRRVGTVPASMAGTLLRLPGTVLLTDGPEEAALLCGSPPKVLRVRTGSAGLADVVEGSFKTLLLEHLASAGAALPAAAARVGRLTLGH